MSPKEFIQNTYYFLIRSTLKAWMRVLFKLDMCGLENLNLKTNFILAGNHTGFLDALVIISSVNRPVRFLVSEEILNWPFIGLLLRIFGEISVKSGNGMKAIEEATQALLNGGIVCIFPEGKLTVDGSIGKFKKGVVVLQKESHLPVIPFAIDGGFEAWGWQSSLKLRKISVKFGSPITFDAKLEDDECINQFRERVLCLKKELEEKKGTNY